MNKQIKKNKVESTKQPTEAQPLCQVETDVRRFFSIFRKLRSTVQMRNSFDDGMNFEIILTGSDIIDIIKKYTKI